MNEKSTVFTHYKTEKTLREIQREIKIQYGIKPEEITNEMTRKNTDLKNLYFEWRRKIHESSIQE